MVSTIARLAVYASMAGAIGACGRIDFDTGRLGVLEQQRFIKASTPDLADFFGNSVALSADGATLAVGARFEDSAATTINGDELDNSRMNAGAAYVFVREGGTLAQQAYLKGDAGPNAEFGFAVALSGDGDTLVATAPLAGGGEVFVFVRTGVTWALQAKLSPPSVRSLFGYSADISEDGDTIAVGDYERENRTGAAYVYTRSGSTWSLPFEVLAPNREPGDVFSDVLALSADGTTLVVGAPWEDSAGHDGSDNSLGFAGAAYVFRRMGQIWELDALLKAGTPQSGDRFGSSVASSRDGTRLAIAAGGVNGFAGAAYVLDRDTSGWRETAALSPADAEPGDEAAWKIALSSDGRVLAFGARSEGSAFPDDPTDDSLTAAGAAWVFVDDPTWREHAFLKSDEISMNDSFGTSVAVVGSTIVVGATGEASGSGGIDQNRDEAKFSAGAVYLFE